MRAIYEKAELFIVATALICTSSAMTGNQMHIILNSKHPLIYIITYLQA